MLAQEALPVLAHVDLGNGTSEVGRRACALGMATAAELARRRLGGRARARRFPVLVRHLMTPRAGHRRVARRRFRPGNLAVARGAARRCARWRRGRVRRMAGDATLAGIVRSRLDLREAGRTRRIVPVTARAEVPLARHARFHLGRVFDVGCRRAVARFAPDELVAPSAVRLDHVRVAVGARFATGILDRPGGDLRDRGRAVMTDLAERARYKKVPRDDQRDAEQQEHHQQPRHLLRHARALVITVQIRGSIAHTSPFFRRCCRNAACRAPADCTVVDPGPLPLACMTQVTAGTRRSSPIMQTSEGGVVRRLPRSRETLARKMIDDRL